MSKHDEKSQNGKDNESEKHEKLLHTKERLNELYGYAIEAEKKTGVKEETFKEAKRSLTIRIATITFGSVITILGILMLALPGPGLLVTAIGLGILSKDVPFARRWLRIVKDRLPQDEQGELTKGTIATMIIIAIVGITASAFSLWFTFWR